LPNLKLGQACHEAHYLGKLIARSRTNKQTKQWNLVYKIYVVQKLGGIKLLKMEKTSYLPNSVVVGTWHPCFGEKNAKKKS
jgi:hypothetical protein